MDLSLPLVHKCAWYNDEAWRAVALWVLLIVFCGWTCTATPPSSRAKSPPVPAPLACLAENCGEEANDLYRLAHAHVVSEHSTLIELELFDEESHASSLVVTQPAGNILMQHERATRT